MCQAEQESSGRNVTLASSVGSCCSIDSVWGLPSAKANTGLFTDERAMGELQEAGLNGEMDLRHIDIGR